MSENIGGDKEEENDWKNGVTTPLITLIIYHDLYDYDVFPLTIRGTIIHNDVVNTI